MKRRLVAAAVPLSALLLVGVVIVAPSGADVTTQLQAAQDQRANCLLARTQATTSSARTWARDCIIAMDAAIKALTPTTTTAPSVPPSTVPTTTVPTTTPPPPTTPPPSSGWPTPETTGVPTGTVFGKTVGTTTITTPGQVVDRWHVTGSLIVKAAGVVITNSQVDDAVVTDGGSFTITDSTVGPATCGVATWQSIGLGFSNYTALRVEVRGQPDGFRASGTGVVIRDSYYRACVRSSADHADGVQDYPSASGIVVDHNTFDMAGLSYGFTAPIFVHSTSTSGATITNNLVLGGVYSVYLQPSLGRWVVTGNRVAAGSYAYGPYEAEGKCSPPGGMTWSDNDVVTLTGYAVASTVKDNVPCPA